MSVSRIDTARTGSDLIAGDPEALWEDAGALASQVHGYDDLRARLGRIDTGTWEGSTADRFADTVSTARTKLEIASQCLSEASRALATHGNVLSWAQEQATECIARWRAGSYCEPAEVGNFLSIGRTAEQDSAAAALSEVRAAVDASARATASVLNQAVELGPDDLRLGIRAILGAVGLSYDANPWHRDAGDEVFALMASVVVPGGGGALGAVEREAATAGRVPLMTLGESTTKNYRGTFFKTYPELKGETLWVHHAIERQVVKNYPDIITESQLHSATNLRGIPTAVNSEIHLRQIRRMWDDFYVEHPPGTATLSDFLQHARYVDEQIGASFRPPVLPEAP